MTRAALEKLGNLLEVQSGFAFKKEYFSDSQGVPLIRIRDLPNSTTETNYSGPYRAEFLVEPGDYLIGMDGEFRCHVWRGRKALLNQRVCRLRKFRSVVEPLYVYYAIQEFLKDIEERTPFATVKHISARQIENIQIPLPSKDKQLRIIDLLSRAENIVRMRREAEEKTKEIIPALFLDVFGDPATNPKAWPVLRLGDLLIDGPKNGLYKHASLYGEGTPILRIDSFYDGIVSKPASLRRVRVSEVEQEAFALREGDLVLNRVNSPEHLGKSAIVPALSEPTVFESNMMRLRVNADAIVPGYLIQLLQQPTMRRALIINAKHAINQSSINQTDVRGLDAMVPPVVLQKAFVARVDSIFELLRRQAEGVVVAGVLFQSVLAGSFREKRG